MSQVLLKNVTKVFGGSVVAVNDISIEITDKEFMVIVGPSGCGKNTTLIIIAGIEDITEGQIIIDGTIVNDVPPKDRDIAMVFQNYALYPHMTVYQNMAFALKLRKTPKDEIRRRINDTARILGIDALMDRKPKALSGGQRQRVALGRAIVRKPKAFLFDEPLSNLDAKLRVTTRSELKALHRRLQTTSIYVTHDQAEAMTLGDRICVMHEGRVQQIASPMEVYDQPANRFVAGFLGTPPMNFFNGRIAFNNDEPYFVIGDEKIKLPIHMKDMLVNFKNDEMAMGIRPEHISHLPIENQVQNTMRSTVMVVEPLGDRKEVYMENTFGQKYIANTNPHANFNINQSLPIYLNTDKIHVFELGNTGTNITCGATKIA